MQIPTAALEEALRRNKLERQEPSPPPQVEAELERPLREF